MAKPRLSLRSRKDDELGQFAKRILTALTDNPQFPQPQPSLAELAAARQAYQSSLTGVALQEAELRAAVALKKKQRRQLERLLTQLAGHITSVSRGEVLNILSAGLDVADRRSPVGRLPPPGNLRAATGLGEGLARLRWQPHRRARAYEVELQEQEPRGKWQRVTVVTASRARVTGLTSGRLYCFRVRSLATAGPTPGLTRRSAGRGELESNPKCLSKMPGIRPHR